MLPEVPDLTSSLLIAISSTRYNNIKDNFGVYVPQSVSGTLFRQECLRI